MNHYQIAWLEQFLRPAIHLLTPLWPVMRPVLRLATALTAATVAFQLTAEEGLGIWLALGAGLMSWNFLFTDAAIAKAVDEIVKVKIADETTNSDQADGYCINNDHAYEDSPTNIWHDPSRY